TGGIVTARLTDSLLDVSKEKAALTAKNTALVVDAVLRREMDFAATVALDRELIDAVSEKRYASAIHRARSVCERVKVDYLAILIVDTDGIVRSDTDHDTANVNVSDRRYFARARSGSMDIEGPFISRRTGRRMLAISAPVFKQHEFVGALVVALEMNYLVAMTSSITAGKTGHAFITDRDGVILVHPQKDLVLNVNIGREPGVERLAARLRNGETGSETISLRGVKKIAGFAPITLTDWGLSFAQDYDEIIRPLRSLFFFLLICGCLFLALTISILSIVFRQIGAPAQKSMDLLHKLIEHSESAILTMALDRKITYANPAAEVMLGRRNDELIGSEPVLENMCGKQPEAIWDDLRRGRVWSGNVVVKTAERQSLTLAVMVVPVTGVSGKVESYLEIARDITEEQRLQSRLFQSQKMEALGAMAGGIAHDFNNILSVIFAYTELSLTASGNPAETQENLSEILTASERARDLVRQILAFSRSTDQELRPISPKPIVKEALKLLRASIPSEIELQTSIVSDATVMADPIQIHQIVVNLCTNAAHALGSTSGSINVALEDMVVDDDFARGHPGLQAGNHILLRITDSGKGIEPQIIDRIFEPFFTTKRAGEGTGLGLSVVHGSVKKLNGVITVYSGAGEGAVFNIIIPALTLEPGVTGPTALELVGGTERILLVDDEKSVGEPVANILRSVGYRVSFFATGVEALDAFKRNADAFDLVITDYSMPRMTGLEFVEKIRQIRKDIRIIVHSGHVSGAIAELFTQIGVSSILTKPVDSYRLADAIRKAFNSG
ncbi:MAG: response regulator, partial [Myxococcales bacterium]